MSPRNLIDVEMEQTGEAAKSPSYQARQANSDTAKRRSAMFSILSKASGVSQFNPYPQSSAKNPATGQSWFEVPSAEYQAWDARKQDKGLEIRRQQGEQDIDLNIRKTKEWQPLANDEANRALGNELQTRNKALGNELAIRLPYSSFEQNLVSMRQAGVNAANMTSSISGAYSNSVSRLNPVSMGL